MAQNAFHMGEIAATSDLFNAAQSLNKTSGAGSIDYTACKSDTLNAKQRQNLQAALDFAQQSGTDILITKSGKDANGKTVGKSGYIDGKLVVDIDGNFAEQAKDVIEARKDGQNNDLKEVSVVGVNTYSDDLPQGFTRESFNKFVEDLQEFAIENDLPKGEVLMQGSRVSGTATQTSDVDIMLRVDKDTFDMWVSKRLEGIPEGTRLYKTIEKAARKGKLSKFDISKTFGKNLSENFIPISPISDVDFSIILRESQYDTGPYKFMFNCEGKG